MPELEDLEILQLMLQASPILGIGSFDLLPDLFDLVFSVEHVSTCVN